MNREHAVSKVTSYGVYHLGPLLLRPTGLTGLLYQPRMMMDVDEYRTIGGMLGKGNRSTRRKPAPAPLCPPQIPHDLTRARTRSAVVGSQRLTA
jgi:hypothetical protein